MESLELFGWRVEYDRSSTIVAHHPTSATGPEMCGCEPCRNRTASRDRLLQDAFRGLLSQLGIPVDREAEVYHNCRLESGRHSYGAWYHFIGRVLHGERECSQNAAFGPFSVSFHSKPVLLPEIFVGRPVVQLEVVAEVPWLSDVPESP